MDENDIEKIIHQMFLNFIFLNNHFSHKHDFSLLVNHENFIIEYFNGINMSNERKEDP